MKILLVITKISQCLQQQQTFIGNSLNSIVLKSASASKAFSRLIKIPHLLTDIANLSFKTGIFPDLCKLSKIIPIFKKDDPMLCVNYRSMSLLSIFSKIFEKLICYRMYLFLDSNNLIHEKQFGFRAKHSVNHALISTTELIKSKLENGIQSMGIQKIGIQTILKF